MGIIKNILVKKEINPIPDIYSNFFQIERCEDMQIHWRNNRLQFTGDEFRIYLQMCIKAYQNWQEMNLADPDSNSKIIQGLAGCTAPDPKKAINSTFLAIEEQQQAGYIQFHYRSLRLDLSEREFLEIADAFEEAKKKYAVMRK